MKKVIIILISAFIAFSPFATLGNFSFADSGSSYPTIGGGSGGGWTNVDFTDPKAVVSAFKAYCASRNLKFVHVPNDYVNVTEFNYTMIKNAADALNIDLTTLNAYVWYTYYLGTAGEIPVLKYFYHPSALDKLNDIQAKIIQDYNIQANQSKNIYSGKYFKDDNGNSCYCFIKNTGIMTDTQTMTNVQYTQQVTGIGSMLLTTGNKIFADTINGQKLYFPFVVHGNTYTFCTQTFKQFDQNGNIVDTVDVYQNEANSSTPNASPSSSIYLQDGYYNTQDGYFTVICLNNGNTPYLGYFCRGVRKTGGLAPYYCLVRTFSLSNPDLTPATVTADRGEETTPDINKSLTVTTNSETINNYITNNIENNTYNYSTEVNPPSNKPDPLPPTDNFPTGVTDPNGNPFNFTMPEIGIDWNLNFNAEDLPFPFSIPFDIIRFLTILDTEPEAPKYEIHTSILNYPVNLDIDLSVFDDGMEIIRNIILAGYVIFLIISTRALFHIY